MADAALRAPGHRGFGTPLVLLLLWCSQFLPSPATAASRIAPLAAFCGTPAVLEAINSRPGQHLDPGGAVAKMLQRPLLEHHALSPSGRFRVHYTLAGLDSVDSTDRRGNGVPDYVDSVAAALDRAWVLQVEELGYRAPPADGGAGGGDELDVYLVDLGQWSNARYGVTYPESSGPTSSTFMELDNNYTNPAYGRFGDCEGHTGVRGYDAMRVTVAHELFHMIQFGYYQGQDGSWWQEATSTWMEDVAYPRVDDYLQYLCDFLDTPGRSIDSGNPALETHPYGAALFAHFLAQRHDPTLVRTIWEELGSQRSADLAHFDHVLRDVSEGGLMHAMGEFGVWNYFTGDRHRDGFYAEGYAYPKVPVESELLVPDLVTSIGGRVDHLGNAYISLLPDLRRGGVAIDSRYARGRWRRQLVLVSPDSVEIQQHSPLGLLRLHNWEVYDDVVLVITSTEYVGGGYDFEVDVTHDSDLALGEQPLALSLGDAWPNPFRPDTDGRATLPYALDSISAVTRLSVFSATGQLVRRYDLGRRAASQYQARWDGRNFTGQLVGSGVYTLRLESDGRALLKTIAVIRD